MELDDFKQAWQTLDRRLEQNHQFNLGLFRERQGDKARAGLRPLVWGQIAQIAFGVLLAVLGGSFWVDHREVLHLLLSGIAVHLYGIATIVSAARTLSLIREVDYAAPVLDIQKQLARLRHFYVRSGMFVGLAWWLMWVPFAIVFCMTMFGADFHVNAPDAVWGGLAAGVVGLLLTWAFHRWSRHASRPRLANTMEASITGASLRRAMRILDEIADFERS